MIKDLTSLRWRKSIYYISDGIIIDISNKKKVDLDECGTYLIDVENAPDFVQKAPDGATLELSKHPEVFNRRVPYIQLRFRNSEADAYVDKYYPLQFLIENGDRVVDGVAVQNHPDVFDDGDPHNTGQNNGYANKWNTTVVDHIKRAMEKRPLFEPKNLKYVMDTLPAWLTSLYDDALFMTEDYVDRQFARGYRYDRTLATKNRSEDNPLLQFLDARIGTGLEAEDAQQDDGWYVPINLWQKDVVHDLIKAIYAERVVNMHDKETHEAEPMKYITKDAKETAADAIKYCEMLPVMSEGVRTFISTDYMYHDCYDVRFESKATDADTYWEWMKKKDSVPTMDVEATIEQDKAYVEDNYGAMPIDYAQGTEPDTIYEFFECCITLHEFMDSDYSEGKVAGVANVFQVLRRAPNSGWNTTVVLISHSGDKTEVVEVNDFWTEDFDLMRAYSEYRDPSTGALTPVQLTKTYTEAFEAMQQSGMARPHARTVVLRWQVGPNKITPQYIFGNVSRALYVSADTLEVKDTNPAFDGYDPLDSEGLLASGLSEHVRSHMYSRSVWSNDDHRKYVDKMRP